MLDWIERAVDGLGYAGIAVLMAAENVFPPIPSEAIMPLAGWTAERGELDFAGVVLAGTVGSVAGALALYGLGCLVDAGRLRSWVGRHGHWLLLSVGDVDQATRWFRSHGLLAVLVARLVPGVRSLVSLPAGFSRMPLGRFVLLTAVGTALWAGMLAWLGTRLKRDVGVLDRYLGPAAVVILAALVVAYFVRALRLRRRRGTGEEGRR